MCNESGMSLQDFIVLCKSDSSDNQISKDRLLEIINESEFSFLYLNARMARIDYCLSEIIDIVVSMAKNKFKLNEMGLKEYCNKNNLSFAGVKFYVNENNWRIDSFLEECFRSWVFKEDFDHSNVDKKIVKTRTTKTKANIVNAD
jgi:hypothetical protein